MEKSTVYFTDFRCPVGTSQLDKLKKLCVAAGIKDIDMDGKFVAIKMHFGELGNMAFLRPNYAKVIADLCKEQGGMPFLTDCNTLYPGSRKNALEHLDCANLNGFNTITTGCQIIIGDGLRGTDDVEVPVENAEYCPTAKIGRAVMDADVFISLTHFKGHEATGFGGASWDADALRARKKFCYSGLYPYAASGHQGVKGGAYSEEGARFVFDKEKLEAANSAYKYEYFNGTSVVEKTATVSPDGTILYIDGKKAAEIVNYAPNKLDANEITYNIKLEEVNPTHAPRSGDAPTEAAKALVGKYVPIKLVADVCYEDACAAGSLLAAAHTATIKEYDAFIIEPLTVTTGETENFTDATVGGSTIDVKGAFTYVSWNADESGKKYIVANTTGLQKALWEFYEVVPGEWMTDQIKSNLKLVNGNLVPTDGVTNGPLPSNTKVVYNQADETLTYNNYSGTPVNWDYKLFIPVKFGYKWKTFTLTFEVDVKKNSGTPAQR